MSTDLCYQFLLLQLSETVDIAGQKYLEGNHLVHNQLIWKETKMPS